MAILGSGAESQLVVSRAGHLKRESEAAPAAISEPGARALPENGRDTSSQRAGASSPHDVGTGLLNQ